MWLMVFKRSTAIPIASTRPSVGRALKDKTTGLGNTALGYQAGIGVSTADNVIAIGTAGVNVSASCYIGNIWNQPGGSQAVYVDVNGKLGRHEFLHGASRTKSSRWSKASEAILALKPVTFRYKKEMDSDGIPQFGLVAEDVEKVNPDLVVRDKEGKPYTVRYEQVNAMLLNEFLKEHRKNEQQESKIAEQEAKIARQEQQIEALTAGFQKVSAQLELNKPATQTVLNDR